MFSDDAKASYCIEYVASFSSSPHPPQASEMPLKENHVLKKELLLSVPLFIICNNKSSESYRKFVAL